MATFPTSSRPTVGHQVLLGPTTWSSTSMMSWPTWRMTTTMATMHSNSVWNMEEQQCWTSWMQQLSNTSFTMSTGLASVWSPTRCRLRTTYVGQQHILTPWRRGFNKEYFNSAWLNWLPNTMSQQDLQLLCQQLDQLKVNKMKW